jgi:hypothetical protein
LDDRHHLDLMTEPGRWGPWINGGGWLTIRSYPVDFLYRDLGKVTTIIDDCLNGKVEIYYQPGHPHGFVSSIYLAEAAICQPLWDPEGLVLELKSKVQPYPDLLQRALIEKFGWEIDFSLSIAKKSIERADVTYAAGCFFRGAMCMLQVLFAINKTHWLNEKGALAIADLFTVKPAMLKSRVEESFRFVEANPHSMHKAIAKLEDLSRDVSALMAGG